MGQPFVLCPIYRCVFFFWDLFKPNWSKPLASVGVEQVRPGQECTFVLILDDRLPFIQWHDFLLMLHGQLFHFPARKSQNAKEIVFKIDTPVCIIVSSSVFLSLSCRFLWESNTSSCFKALFSFSLPTIDKNTGFRLRNAVQIHRHMRSCHAICVALSCHTGCQEVGLKVIVFVYTCNVCYAVLSFLLNWPWIYLHFSLVLIMNTVTAAPH